MTMASKKPRELAESVNRTVEIGLLFAANRWWEGAMVLLGEDRRNQQWSLSPSSRA